MTSNEQVSSAAAGEQTVSGVRRVVGWIFRALKAVLKFLVLFLLIAWAALAIYFSNMPWPWARLALAIAFAFFAIWAVFTQGPL